MFTLLVYTQFSVVKNQKEEDNEAGIYEYVDEEINLLLLLYFVFVLSICFQFRYIFLVKCTDLDSVAENILMISYTQWFSSLQSTNKNHK